MKKIIVVEDDAFSKEYYRYVLKRKGYLPIVLEDGDKLFEELKEDKVSLVIMDISLKNTYHLGKKVDGTYLSRLIKEDFRFKNIPVLLITAYSISADGLEFFEDSLADDYITKPIVDFHELMEKINSLIAKYE